MDIAATSTPASSNVVPPWLAEDCFPPAPETSPYGYRQAKKLVSCSFIELEKELRRDLNRQITLVWTPLQPRLTPPEEVPFLTKALADVERRRAWQQIRLGAIQLVMWGLIIFFSFSSRTGSFAPPIYLLYLLSFALFPLAGYGWTLFRLYSDRWSLPSPAEGRFRVWLGSRPMRWTWVLLGCLLAVGAAQFVVGWDHFLDDGWSTVLAAGLVKPAVREGELWRLMTGPLLHGGFMHFFFNSLALLALGNLTEALIARESLAVTFVLSALGGSLFSLLLLPQPSVGASGGIMGVLGLLIVFGLRRRPQLPRAFLKNMAISVALVAATGLVAYEVIDNPAHFGGLLAGLALGALLVSRGGAIPARPEGPLRYAGWVAMATVVVFSLVAILAILHLLPLS